VGGSKQEKVLEVKNYSLDIFQNKDYIRILDNMNFHIDRGEMLGVAGESGCGKSMMALSIMRLIDNKQKTKGEILFNNVDLLSLDKTKMRDVRGKQISMIFQDPMTSLNPVLTVEKQLKEVFTTHENISMAAAKEKALDALKMVNIAEPEKRINCYPYELSGGMRQRVMIAVALSSRPYLLIADEPTTALDVTIQAQILQLIKDLQNELGMSVMFITHDLGVLAEVCTRAIILYCGRVVEEAQVGELFKEPLHPYTQGLLESLPQIGKYGDLNVIPGNVPSTGHYATGCPFHPRCKYALKKCRHDDPQEKVYAGGRRVKCWLRI
jgi:oligopeptide/dipeptide ABC transporter ATP-binding protein